MDFYGVPLKPYAMMKIAIKKEIGDSMINIRQDLIQKELERGCTNRLTFRKLKPSNRFIDKLFNHYYVVEHTEHFYDSEPEYDDEE